MGSQLRHQLALVDSLASLDDLIASLDLDQPWPGDAADGPRGRAGSERKVILPEGWLESQNLTAEQARQVAEAEAENSGG